MSDEAWALVAPYLTLMTEAAPQREHALREGFNGLRWRVRTGAAWRMLAHDLPPWYTVYQPTQRWLKAGRFEALAQEVRMRLRALPARPPHPRGAILDRRRLPSRPERGPRAGYAGAKRKRGSNVPRAVDTLGHRLGLVVTPANEQARAQVATLAEPIHAATGERVEVAFVDAGHTSDHPAQEAAAQAIHLEVVKLPQAKGGFVRLPRRWVVERSFAWATRFGRLARDDERLPETVKGLHFLAFTILFAKRFLLLFAQFA